MEGKKALLYTASSFLTEVTGVGARICLSLPSRMKATVSGNGTPGNWPVASWNQSGLGPPAAGVLRQALDDLCRVIAVPGA